VGDGLRQGGQVRAKALGRGAFDLGHRDRLVLRFDLKRASNVENVGSNPRQSSKELRKFTLWRDRTKANVPMNISLHLSPTKHM
jgi:hypothetical protein